MNDLGKSFLAVLLALIAFFVATEVAVRIWTRFNISYDIEMSRYANELKVPSENPKIGHVHRPGSSATLMGVDVAINDDGQRDREYALQHDGKHRIVFLGDSLTFAWGVEKVDSFEERLEALLDAQRPTEVINFGTGNYNTEQEVNLFLEKGLAYEPDQVVIFYFINDAEPTPKMSRWAFLGHSRAITFFWSRVGAALTHFSASKSFYEFYSALYVDDAPGWHRTVSAFEAIAEICRERRIALQVVLLPELHDLVDYPFVEEHRKVAAVLARLGVDSLDLAPRFAGEEDPHSLWVALDDAHPNAEAHRRIAEYTLEFIGKVPRALPGEGAGARR